MACVNARATDSRRVAPACCMCAPDTLMGLKRGTSRAQNSITSAVNRRAASTGKSQVPRAMYSFRGSFCSVQGIVLQRAPELRRWHTLLRPHGHIHGEDRRRGGIDGKVGTDFIEGNAVKQELHVGQRVNGDADPPHLLAHPRIVRIKANLRW